MDLAFTPEEQAFREEVRAWVQSNLPKEISHKVHNALRLTRDDLQGWAKILGKKGWLGFGWPKEFGGPGWTAVQKHLFEEECALAGAPRIIPFGPVMVAPVIMAFGNPEQQKRFLPGIASGEVWWSQGYSEPGSGSDLASVKTRAERVGDKYIVNGQKTWTTLGHYGDSMFNLVRTSTEGKPQTGISFLLVDMKSKGVTVRPFAAGDAGQEALLLLGIAKGHDHRGHHDGAEGDDAGRACQRALFFKQVLLYGCPSGAAKFLGPAKGQPAFFAQNLGPALHIVTGQAQGVVHLVGDFFGQIGLNPGADFLAEGLLFGGECEIHAACLLLILCL